MSDALNDQKEFDKMQWRRETHSEHFNNLHDDNKYQVPKTGTYMIGNQKIEVTDGVCTAVKGIEPAGIKHDQDKVEFKKFDADKLSWDLLPVEAIEELLKVLEFGAKRYGKFNWLENADGVEWSRFINALERHLAAFKKGENYDVDSGLYELAHIIANAIFLLTYQIKDLGSDNRDYRLGKVIGKLTCIKFIKRDRAHRWYEFECGYCGATFVTTYNNVQRGNTKSCGCQHYNHSSNKTHGMSTSPLYNRWRGILLRCNDDTAISYPNYGGRGIKVDYRWEKFENFLEDMGHPPQEDYQLDRIDNEGDYCKDNCQWISRQDNIKKASWVKKYSINGVNYTISELSEKYSINRRCLSKRIRMGWELMEALTTPSSKKPEIK